jgi:malate dehydrogenase (oxaloacetate-decarboxylating)
LSEGLYGIEPTLKHLTKNHLGILSVPGVAKVCTAINKQPKLIDTYSMRATSVAIVSRGKMFGGYGRYFLPIMDWFVVQIKVYANIDCYPFVIRSEAPL